MNGPLAKPTNDNFLDMAYQGHRLFPSENAANFIIDSTVSFSPVSMRLGEFYIDSAFSPTTASTCPAILSPPAKHQAHDQQPTTNNEQPTIDRQQCCAHKRAGEIPPNPYHAKIS